MPTPPPHPTDRPRRQRGAIVLTAAGLAALGIGVVATRALDRGHAPDAVSEWNAIGIDAGASLERGMSEQRELAMMHLAMHDALNAIRPVYAPYAAGLGEHPNASPEAAIAAAAHDVLVATVPGKRAELDDAYASALDRVGAGPAREEGVQLGRNAARNILALRAHDGSDRADVADVAQPGIGKWETTPPNHLKALLPGWQYVTPFAMKSADQFLPPPPPALKSAEYARQYNAVKALGAENGSTRTAAQTEQAQWWAGNAGDSWNDIARDTIAQRERQGRDALQLWRNARTFAMLNIAMADGYVSGWNAKYKYRHWRPVTAIPRGDLDGNPATVPDANWMSFLPTPEHPEYPSTHSILSAAAAAALQCALGSDRIDATEDSRSKYTQERRHFTSLKATADDVAMSRLYAGAHFPIANTNGLIEGRQIGELVCKQTLQPVSKH
ncbi:haloperoxidase [Lysobacter helvus]|uniref:Haloperoxidase n=2 Tax=Lysobacteraceae TaxID=32033 RepID=A0ABN6FQ74_9GAMM|nr:MULTISPECIES: vanadium-dependent haloperoxidase [Lysobacter]BCT91781.1 haloperoxidase [Lysobacter caseinilyticus]BCT94934.1 haloperoxidase [Lysobacter helvus]